MNLKWISITASTLLILAIPSGLPYGFYILLRWVISIASGIIMYNSYKLKLPVWTFVFGALVFLFNPISPVYLSKSAWVLVDLVAAILFVKVAYSKGDA